MRDAPGALQNIIISGIERKRIFYDDEDRANFVARLTAILPEATARCYAWALIPNCLPSRIHTGKVPFAISMRRLPSASAVAFYRRHQRQGTLLQNRYKSILCPQT